MKNFGPSARELATDHWPQILASMGLDDLQLSGDHAPCPVCGGVDRFRFDDKEGRGTYFCNGCGPGDGFQLLMKLLGTTDFREAAKEVEKFFGSGEIQRCVQPAKPVATMDPNEERRRIAQTLQRAWEQARPLISTDPVSRYLRDTRKLPLDTAPACLRLHPAMPYYEKVLLEGGKKKAVKRGTHPVMLAKVTDPTGHPVGLHRTYLTMDGKKAPYKKSKKLMESLGLHGAAIRLFPVSGKTIGVAEGIETALAAHALTGIPVWATISSTIMESFEPPAGIETVMIFADNDLADSQGKRAGQHAAKKLKERLEGMGIQAKIVLPAKAGSDFHDIWVASQEKGRASRKASGATQHVAA